MTSRPTVLASIVLALALLGDSLLYAVLPLYAATFGVSLAWVGVLLSANRVIRLFAYPFLPGVAEEAGLRRFTIGAAAVGGATTLAFAVGSGAWVLLASRVAWGVVFGALSLSALAYATAGVDVAGKRVGLSLAVREAGPLLSLTLGTAAVSLAGVRPALATLGMLSLAGVVVAARLPAPPAAGRPDRRQLAGGDSEEADDNAGWQPAVRPAGGRRSAIMDWCSLIAGFVADGIFPATIGLLIARSAGVGEAAIGAGLLLAMKRVAVVVLAPAGGHASDRFGGRVVTAAGFAIAATGALLIALEGVIAGAVLLSCGAALTATAIPVSIASSPAGERVPALARSAMARDAGAAAGPPVALALFGVAGASAIYAAAGVALAAAGIFAILRFSNRRRSPMRLVSCVAAFAFLLAPVVRGKDAPKSVQVDCSKGQSINAALGDSAEGLIVEFSGVCAEDVAIRRGAVTLRGIAPGAKISGAASPAAPAAAVLIRGVSDVTLQNFAVQDGDRRGVDVQSASAVTLDGVVADGNFSDGLRVVEGSSVFVRNSSFDQNGGDGIGVWQNSNVIFEGAISLDDNDRIGLLLSGSSEASVTFFGAQITANGNARCGYFLQLGAAAQLAAAGPTTVTASGNGDCGVGLLDETAWAGPLTVQNSPVGVDVTSSTFESAALSATGTTTALFAHLGSYVALRAASVTGNPTGIRLDGASAQINNTSLQGNGTDLRLQFGARASFNAASSAATVSCDSTVLVRGPVTCPPSALAGERTGSLRSQEVPVARTPAELLPE